MTAPKKNDEPTVRVEKETIYTITSGREMAFGYTELELEEKDAIVLFRSLAAALGYELVE